MSKNILLRSQEYIDWYVGAGFTTANTIDTGICTFKRAPVQNNGKCELNYFICPNVFSFLNRTEGCYIAVTANGINFVVDLQNNSEPTISSVISWFNTRCVASGAPNFYLTLVTTAIGGSRINVTNAYGVDATLNFNLSSPTAPRILGFNPKAQITIPALTTVPSGVMCLEPNEICIRVNDMTDGNNQTAAATFNVKIDSNSNTYIATEHYTSFDNTGKDPTKKDFSGYTVSIFDDEGGTYNMDNVCWSLNFKLFQK